MMAKNQYRPVIITIPTATITGKQAPTTGRELTPISAQLVVGKKCL